MTNWFYGAKNPEISRTKCDACGTNALTEPFVVGTIARFEVIAPSPAFRVETNGWVAPCGQSVRKSSGAGGTTVAFSTNAWADAGAPQPLAPMLISSCPLNAGVPAGLRLSSARHGVNGKSDNPPCPGGAKYPLMSITRSELSVTKTLTPPFVPAGTMAA